MTTELPVDKGHGDTRTLILDATEQIMIEHGYAGVSSRKVAEQAGLKSKLLHYYFKSMDDLFTAAFHRLEDRYDERFARAAASDTPLHDLWALLVDPASASLILEFTALANHRPAVREMIARSARRDRSNFGAVLDAIFGRYGIDREKFPPKFVALLTAGLARALATERTLGADDGHAQALEMVALCLNALEPSAGARPNIPPAS